MSLNNNLSTKFLESPNESSWRLGLDCTNDYYDPVKYNEERALN